jgi:hypothetical protein
VLRIQAVGKRRGQLEAQVNPASANEPEAIPWVYYDSQNIANAAAGPISFFANSNADKTLSNLEQSGTIPDPFYFEIEAFNLDFLAKGGTTVTAAGVMEDLAEILYTQRAVFVFTFAGKEYLRIPLTFLHASGGPLGVVSANLTAPLIYEFANNSFPDGGFYIGKRITIPPKQSWQVQIQLAGAATLVATRMFRVSMAGVLHRRVL